MAGSAVMTLGIIGVGTVAAAPVASAQPRAVAHSGFKVKVIATGLGGNIKPDDVAQLGNNVFVGYQNGVGPTGGAASGTGATKSTIVEYKKKKIVGSWQVSGRCDGLAGNPATGEILASVNEDGNSSIYAINPVTNAVFHLTYNVDPTTLGGGGTDAISVSGGQILISGSNPSTPSAPAVYSVALNETTMVATLTPVFADNATATGPSGPVVLNLTDPDSNAFVPSTSPLFGGDFALVSQADQQVIFVQAPGTAGQTLTQLPIGTNVDDITWVTSTTGALYMTDNTNNTLYQISGAFTVGTVFVDTASDSGVPGTLSTLNLTTGQVTPVVVGFANPHGLRYVG